MSQQINLLNPDLRPRRDWLAFSAVAPAALAALVLVVGNAIWVRVDQARLEAREQQVAQRLKAAQDQAQALAKAIAARGNNAALRQEAERLAAALQQRREAMAILRSGGSGDGPGFSAIMEGLARQAMDGLWLTGFTASSGDLEIRGRMLDPALLPAYIRRLNGEPAFQGRRFAELEMQDVMPPAAGEAAARGAGVAAPASLPRHTEFVLRTSPAPARPGGVR